MQKKTIEQLMEMAIAVEDGTMALRPIENKKIIFNSSVESSMENCYCSNSGIIAFVKGGIMYVIPYMSFVMDTLNEFSFKRKTMYVPFSNHEYPIGQKNKWEALLKMAEKERAERFQQACEKYADKHGYLSIASNLLTDYCMEVPTEGIHYVLFQHSNVVFPEITGYCFDTATANAIGKYCIENGVCSFVYRDGKTYITKNSKVINALQHAGFMLGHLNVPFTKGEIITDSDKASKWKNIA